MNALSCTTLRYWLAAYGAVLVAAVVGGVLVRTPIFLIVALGAGLLARAEISRARRHAATMLMPLHREPDDDVDGREKSARR